MGIPMGVNPTENNNPSSDTTHLPVDYRLSKGVPAKNGRQYTHGAGKLKLLQGHVRFEPKPSPRTGDRPTDPHKGAPHARFHRGQTRPRPNRATHAQQPPKNRHHPWDTIHYE